MLGVLHKHRISLQRIFTYYAHLKKPVWYIQCKTHNDTLLTCVESQTIVPKGAPRTMLINDFVRWLRDIQALDANLTPLAVKHIFAHTQLVRPEPCTVCPLYDHLQPYRKKLSSVIQISEVAKTPWCTASSARDCVPWLCTKCAVHMSLWLGGLITSSASTSCPSRTNVPRAAR